MALQLERANSSRRIGPWSLLGLVLIPLLVAGGFLWANWNSDTRLARVQAAVVNLDEPVKINGQPVPLGRQLTGGLVADNADRNFSWVLTDEQDASDGLESGRYAAVVTIPETSLDGQPPSPRPIRIRCSPQRSTSVPRISPVSPIRSWVRRSPPRRPGL